jgi:hypothetical protein
MDATQYDWLSGRYEFLVWGVPATTNDKELNTKISSSIQTPTRV